MVSARLLAMLRCLTCHGELHEITKALECGSCKAVYPVEDNVPDMLHRSARKEGELDYQTHYVQDSVQFDYFEERSGGTAHSERRLRESLLAKLGSPSSLLDVGCGSAWVAKHFQNSDTFVCSLDISPVNPKKAMQRYPSRNHVGLAADSYSLPFADSEFDAVVAAEIIEHVPDPARFVQELLRVVRPGGMLLLSTPYLEKIAYEICIHCNQRTPHNAHLHSFDENSIVKLFAHLPASMIEWWTFNNKVLLYARTYPILKYLPHRAWEIVDRGANALLNKPVNIIVRVQKA